MGVISSLDPSLIHPISSAGFFYECRKPLSSEEVPLLAAGSAMQIPGSAVEWEAEMPAAAVLTVAP